MEAFLLTFLLIFIKIALIRALRALIPAPFRFIRALRALIQASNPPIFFVFASFGPFGPSSEPHFFNFLQLFGPSAHSRSAFGLPSRAFGPQPSSPSETRRGFASRLCLQQDQGASPPGPPLGGCAPQTPCYFLGPSAPSAVGPSALPSRLRLDPRPFGPRRPSAAVSQGASPPNNPLGRPLRGLLRRLRLRNWDEPSAHKGGKPPFGAFGPYPYWGEPTVPPSGPSAPPPLPSLRGRGLGAFGPQPPTLLWGAGGPLKGPPAPIM